MKKFFLLCCFLLFLSGTSKLLAIVRLPPIMSSNMVLQQNTQATLWGWADPSERFTITLSNVFNKEGLPIIPFRTDNWDVSSLVKK
jgi:sialate O-acetylesterase